MDSTETSLQELEIQLMQWGERMDRLSDDAGKTGDSLSAAFRQRLDELNAQHETAQARLEKLGRTKGHRWARFRIGMGRTWHELVSALKELKP